MIRELKSALHVQMKYRSLNRYRKVNKHLLTWMNYILTFGLSTRRVRNSICSIFYLSISVPPIFIVTCTMRGIFRFSFSSHQINQFYEQQIGELRSNAQIFCLLPPSLSLAYFLLSPLTVFFGLLEIPLLSNKFNRNKNECTLHVVTYPRTNTIR